MNYLFKIPNLPNAAQGPAILNQNQLERLAESGRKSLRAIQDEGVLHSRKRQEIMTSDIRFDSKVHNAREKSTARKVNQDSLLQAVNKPRSISSGRTMCLIETEPLKSSQPQVSKDTNFSQASAAPSFFADRCVSLKMVPELAEDENSETSPQRCSNDELETVHGTRNSSPVGASPVIEGSEVRASEPSIDPLMLHKSFPKSPLRHSVTVKTNENELVSIPIVYNRQHTDDNWGIWETLKNECNKPATKEQLSRAQLVTGVQLKKGDREQELRILLLKSSHTGKSKGEEEKEECPVLTTDNGDDDEFSEYEDEECGDYSEYEDEDESYEDLGAGMVKDLAAASNLAAARLELFVKQQIALRS